MRVSRWAPRFWRCSRRSCCGGLNFGIDFLGGTTIRTESTQSVDVAAYRQAIEPLSLGDVSITEVFDPNFGPDQNVAMIRIQAQEGQESVTPETIAQIEASLQGLDPAMTFPSVESVGPKVSISGFGSNGSSRWGQSPR